MKTRRSRAEWARDVRNWRESGLTARAYGQEAGVSPSQLSWWKWKLGLGGCIGNRRASARQRRSLHTPQAALPARATAFVEARLVLGELCPLAPTVEVVVGSGRVLRVGRGFDPELVLAVVKLLEGAP